MHPVAGKERIFSYAVIDLQQRGSCYPPAGFLDQPESSFELCPGLSPIIHDEHQISGLHSVRYQFERFLRATVVAERRCFCVPHRFAAFANVYQAGLENVRDSTAEPKAECVECGDFRHAGADEGSGKLIERTPKLSGIREERCGVKSAFVGQRPDEIVPIGRFCSWHGRDRRRDSQPRVVTAVCRSRARLT